jgi:CDP-6-deoxy-D-xylo-4-hexulose-3-dehydrase
MNISFIIDENCPVLLSEVVKIFENSGIETRPIITGNFANQPAAKYISQITSYPNAQIISDRGFMIGCHATKITELLSESINAVSAKLSSF